MYFEPKRLSLTPTKLHPVVTFDILLSNLFLLPVIQIVVEPISMSLTPHTVSAVGEGHFMMIISMSAAECGRAT